jgi:hypothetical protein
MPVVSAVSPVEWKALPTRPGPVARSLDLVVEHGRERNEYHLTEQGWDLHHVRGRGRR